MGSAWYYVVNEDRVEIHVRSSCGAFLLSALPFDWRIQFQLPDVQDAIMAELSARQIIAWPDRRKAIDEIARTDVLPLSWYSIRARLAPSTLDPVLPPGAGTLAPPIDGRYLDPAAMMPPGQVMSAAGA